MLYGKCCNQYSWHQTHMRNCSLHLTVSFPNLSVASPSSFMELQFLPEYPFNLHPRGQDLCESKQISLFTTVTQISQCAVYTWNINLCEQAIEIFHRDQHLLNLTVCSPSSSQLKTENKERKASEVAHICWVHSNLYRFAWTCYGTCAAHHRRHIKHSHGDLK